MNVLQLIDSLQTGGAERVAVNIANSLTAKIGKSFLCATRDEGPLKESLSDKVNYLFLNKQKTIDFRAISRLIKYVKNNKIDIIHAHSSSYFLASIIKILNRKIKIVWHDHYGNSEFLEQRQFRILRLFSNFFTHIISVNNKLKGWSETKLKFKEVNCLPNFATTDVHESLTKLYGNADKRILHLANLRAQKDHVTLFKAFRFVLDEFPDWTLHCVGKDFYDDYSLRIKTNVKEMEIDNSVFFYGSKKDVSNIISQSNIGILSSKSEGLPISLLEYGLHKLPVVVTNVGDCQLVVKHNKAGLVVQRENPQEMANAIKSLLFDGEKAKDFGEKLKEKVDEFYSEEAYLISLLDIYNSVV